MNNTILLVIVMIGVFSAPTHTDTNSPSVTAILNNTEDSIKANLTYVEFMPDEFMCGDKFAIGCSTIGKDGKGYIKIANPNSSAYTLHNMTFQHVLTHELGHIAGGNETQAELYAINRGYPHRVIP
jgi:hypothetical protein